MIQYFLQKKIIKFIYSLLAVLFLFMPFVEASEYIRGVNSYSYVPINASNNARGHNNMGNIYFKEENYVAALKEYEIAYNLEPYGKYGAVYLYNIARCFMISNKYKEAKKAIQGCIKKDYMNITYYNALADIIALEKNSQNEIKKYLQDKTNPYNRVLVGLIYIKTNKIKQARTILDEFVANNPNLIMTEDIKTILKNI